jgi:carbohydrate kinase (thermoresistant glucokinase family)
VTVHVIMGVASSGKTTVGRLLAQRLGVPFAEGDVYHPAGNVAKMSRGEPLDDDDRRPWLEAIARDIARWCERGEGAVVGCSALKRSYRDILRGGGRVRFIHLSGAADVIRERMAARRDHFMPVTLLPSQMATLEAPGDDEDAITVDVSGTPEQIVAAILQRLDARS